MRFLFGNVGQQRDGTRALDGDGELTLVTGTGAGHTAGKDLGALRNELSQLRNILVINAVNLVYTEDANLLLSVYRAEGTCIFVISVHETVQNLSDPKILSVPTKPGVWQGGYR